MKLFNFLFILFVIAIYCFSSCNKKDLDPCENVVCSNGGICVDGICEIDDPCIDVICLNGADCESGNCICPSGYSGIQCETYTSVEERLNNETPLEIAESGMPLDSLYGKWYAGGYIFYVDTGDIILNKEGLVASEYDIEGTLNWGCLDQDTEATNVSSNPTFPETELGARPGDGIDNTLKILESDCSVGSPAEACHNHIENGYDDWFLPSRGGVILMHYFLEERGIGNFNTSSYWTSTESSFSKSWLMGFNQGNPQPALKTSIVFVRAARAF